MFELYKITPDIDKVARGLALVPVIVVILPLYVLVEIFNMFGNLIGWISNQIKIQAGVFSLDQYNDFEGWKLPATGKYYNLQGREFGDKHKR
jgi:hypothetical protein